MITEYLDIHDESKPVFSDGFVHITANYITNRFSNVKIITEPWLFKQDDDGQLFVTVRMFITLEHLFNFLSKSDKNNYKVFIFNIEKNKHATKSLISTRMITVKKHKKTNYD